MEWKAVGGRARLAAVPPGLILLLLTRASGDAAAGSVGKNKQAVKTS